MEKESPQTRIGRRATPLLLHRRLYLDTMEIRRDEGLGHKKIAEELARRYSIRVPHSTVYFWITGRSNPLGRWNLFELRASKELAYVMGVKFGDASKITYRPQYKEEVKLWVRDADFAENFNLALAKLFNREHGNNITAEVRDGALFYGVRYSSVELGKILDRPLDELKQFIETHPSDFIMGFLDSEGCASVTITHDRLRARVFVTNSNMEILLYIQDLLRRWFEVDSVIYLDKTSDYVSMIHGRMITRNKPTYSLRISRMDSVMRFHKLIGFSIARKRTTLDDGLRLIENYKSRIAAVHWKQLYRKQGRRWVRMGTA